MSEVKRKFYANFASSVPGTRRIDKLCPQGHRMIQDITTHPAPYLIEPPFEETPLEYQERTEIHSEWCPVCSR